MGLTSLLPKRIQKIVNPLVASVFYERPVVKFYEKHAPYDVAVDVGAGVGFHVRRLAKLSRKVIAIEPIAELRRMPINVEVYRVAVGSGFGRARMRVEGTHVNGTVGAEAKFSDSGEVEVEVVPLDNIVTEADFLKVDVEGAENEILMSCKLMDSVEYAVIETHEGFDYSLLSDFKVEAIKKREDLGHYLLCVRRR